MEFSGLREQAKTRTVIVNEPPQPVGTNYAFLAAVEVHVAHKWLGCIEEQIGQEFLVGAVAACFTAFPMVSTLTRASRSAAANGGSASDTSPAVIR